MRCSLPRFTPLITRSQSKMLLVCNHMSAVMCVNWFFSRQRSTNFGSTLLILIIRHCFSSAGTFFYQQPDSRSHRRRWVFIFLPFHGLKSTGNRQITRNIRTLYRLLLGRGYSSARRWLIHRTKSALAPPLTLSQWFHHYLEPTVADQSPSSQICTKEPRVLVLLPVGAGDTVTARQTFQSLLKQSYSQWQLLMLPTSDAPIELIQELSKSAVKEPKLR